MSRFFIFIRENKIYIFAYFIIILCCYIPVIINNCAFGDDWWKLYRSINHIKLPLDAEITAGRPLYALLIFLSQKFIFLSDSLTFFKVLDILAILLFSLFFFYFLRINEYFNSNFLLQFLLPLTLAVSPPLYLYAAWYTCWPFSFAVLTSLVAFYLLTSTSYPTKTRIFLSLFFLMVSFAIYQSAALLFLLYLSLYIGKYGYRNKIVIIALCICGISMLFSIFLVKIVPIIFNYRPQPRAELKYDIYNAIVFFWDTAFPYAIKALFVSNLNMIGILFCSCVLLYALIIYTNFSFKAILFIVALLMLSFSPVMMTTRYMCIRVTITVICFILTFLMIGIIKITPWEKLNNVLVLLFSIFIISNTTISFYNDFIISNQEDFEQLSALVNPYLKEPPYCVNLVLTNPNKKTRKRTFYFEELAGRSSFVSWAYRGMLANIYFLNNLPTKVVSHNPRCVNVLQRSIGDQSGYLKLD